MELRNSGINYKTIREYSIMKQVSMEKIEVGDCRRIFARTDMNTYLADGTIDHSWASLERIILKDIKSVECQNGEQILVTSVYQWYDRDEIDIKNRVVTLKDRLGIKVDKRLESDIDEAVKIIWKYGDIL